jgi:hypothetical protein
VKSKENFGRIVTLFAVTFALFFSSPKRNIDMGDHYPTNPAVHSKS